MFIFTLTGLMGGAFLGGVEGMVEESSPKTIRGSVLGAAGGALGGLVFVFLKEEILFDEKILWALFFYWAIPGAFIGIVSALWEKKPKKIIAGVVSGFLGGGTGGYLGAALHANLVQQIQPETWFVQRLFESLVGGFIGLALWFAIGAAERYVIFDRRLVTNKDHKECDQCEEKNPLSSWYCGRCGSVLQVSVPVEKLNYSPYHTLNRLTEMFRFLSRLATSTGFIASFVSLFILLPGPPFVIIGVVVFIALISYVLQAFFSSLSETLLVFMKGSGVQ